jgi:hypothetical protein
MDDAERGMWFTSGGWKKDVVQALIAPIWLTAGFGEAYYATIMSMFKNEFRYDGYFFKLHTIKKL